MSASATRPAWPVNAWYVAAAEDEVLDRPFARQVCGHHMVFFRGAAGVVAALEDYCPHRGAPLSLGVVRGDTIVCGYHGLAMACTGRADSMPGQTVKNFPAIRVFPSVERYGFIWVWPGDPAAADPATLPRLDWAERDDWAYGGGRFHVRCDYRLMVDNLMDLTHETYVHGSSIGQKEIDEAPVSTHVDGTEVVTSRFMTGVGAPPFWQMNLRAAGLPDNGAVDRWQVCRFALPSHVMIEVGVAIAGKGGYAADDGDKVAAIVVDFMTPETETSHWYFWGMARRFAVHDETLTEAIRAGQTRIFSEDLEMLERQQQTLLRYPDRRPIRLNIDAGGARSRLLIDRAIATEQAA